MEAEKSKAYNAISTYLLANVADVALVARYRGEFEGEESEYSIDKSILITFDGVEYEGEDFGRAKKYRGELLVYVACVNMAHSYKTASGNADQDNAVADWEFVGEVSKQLGLDARQANGGISHVKYLDPLSEAEQINDQSLMVHLLRYQIEFCA